MSKRANSKRPGFGRALVAAAAVVACAVVVSSGIAGVYAVEGGVGAADQSAVEQQQLEAAPEGELQADGAPAAAGEEPQAGEGGEGEAAEGFEGQSAAEPVAGKRKGSALAAQSASRAASGRSWEVSDTSGVVTVAGTGTKPSEINVATSANRSAYTGGKTVVFGYNVTSGTALGGGATFTVEDCGVMSDDASIEIWKVEGSSAVKIDADLAVKEGSVSFEANSWGEYLAVSDVGTVDLAKGNVTVGYNALQGTQQDGTSVSISYDADKKWRVAQSDNKVRTSYNVVFNGEDNYSEYRTIIVDGLNTDGKSLKRSVNSSYYRGAIDIQADVQHTKLVKLLLRNSNQLRRIAYYTGTGIIAGARNNSDSRLTIDKYNDEAELYIPYKISSREEELAYVLTKPSSGSIGPEWADAGIGGNRNDQGGGSCSGLTIAGGKIRVLAQNQNGATAIGGGGNSDAQLEITGGDITAICSCTGSAIGGGIGWMSRGGNADVSITGGTVYAENVEWYTRYDEESHADISYGGVAIGSGSSMKEEGNRADVKIGGDARVTAYARYGNAIGSGNSYKGSAANATISIGGSSHVTTNALGGGTSKENQGGSADIAISDNAIVDCVEYSKIEDKWDTSNENVLGAFGVGGGNSAGEAKGGSATVRVSGGSLNCNGGNIGGGDATGTGDGGDASIVVTGGSLDCASVGGGDSTTGAPGAVSSADGAAAGIVVTGGTLKAKSIGGGTNSDGDVGFATADVSGGTIQGQFILASSDSGNHCSFKMTGGTIDNSALTKDQLTQSNGGAVYMSDANGSVSITGGEIKNARAALGGAVYMTSGSFVLSGSGTIENCSAEDGGAVYLAGGSLSVSGGAISANKATRNGGGAYLASGALSLSGGAVERNTAENGAGAYLAGGDLTVSGDGSLASNTASNDGAGAYLSGGKLSVEGGSIKGNVATRDGGGAYLAGGALVLSGGSLDGNTANGSGGGAYASDGVVRMFGGSVAGNRAVKDGGGFCVSSDARAADVVVRSGAVASNTAGGNGGGIAVAGGQTRADRLVIGVLENHGADESHNFRPFDYTDDDGTHTHSTCPVLSGNAATGDGGGIYMGSPSATLDIYCLSESGNTSKANSAGNGVMASGGSVNIGDPGVKAKDDVAKGNTAISSSMYVSGGTVTISGKMLNPEFKNNILVDIKGNAGMFEDKRVQEAQAVSEYKVHYFENFSADGEEAAGIYTAKQYAAGEDIKAEGALFSHTGWKITGWQTRNLDGTVKKSYSIGDTIATEGDHSAWGGRDDDPLVLYAVWARTGYTVKFEPNAASYSGGPMDSQAFEYGVEQPLGACSYSVEGMVFSGWNTAADGSGASYPAGYSASKITAQDGAEVTLYAQWSGCAHEDSKLRYDFQDSSVTERCSCGAYRVTLSISAASSWYDGAEHPATLSYEGASGLKASVSPISYEYKASEGDAAYGDLADGESVPKSPGLYRASVTVTPPEESTYGSLSVSVYYAIIDPASGVQIRAAVVAGQRFSGLPSEQHTAIAADDAFTAQFDVANLALTVYQTAPTLAFGRELPKGTSIIMQAGGGYYCLEADGSASSFDVTGFSEMGGEGLYSYDSTKTQSYRFVVDFSKAEAPLPPGELSVSLVYGIGGGQDDSDGDGAGELTLNSSVTLDGAGTFSTTADSAGLSIGAPEAQGSNRWNRKELALVLTPQQAGCSLPPDAQLTAVIGDQTRTCSLTRQGTFVVPLAWAGSQSVQLSLSSAELDVAGKSYGFDVALCTGPTGALQTLIAAKGAPAGASATLSLAIPRHAVPSLKVAGDSRLVELGDASANAGKALGLKLTASNLDGSTFSSLIKKKSEASGDYDGNYGETSGLVAGANSIPLGGITQPGSYCLLVTATQGNAQTLTVPYYFVVR